MSAGRDFVLLAGSAPWTREQFHSKGVDALLKVAQQVPSLRLIFLWRGLLLREVMPDAKAPASPRPQVVEDVLGFLCTRVIELEDGVEGDDAGDDGEQLANALDMTSRLVDLVLYRYHELGPEDVARVEAARHASA